MVWTLARADAAVQEKNVKQKIQSLIQNYNNLEQGNFFKRCKLDLSHNIILLIALKAWLSTVPLKLK